MAGSPLFSGSDASAGSYGDATPLGPPVRRPFLSPPTGHRPGTRLRTSYWVKETANAGQVEFTCFRERCHRSRSIRGNQGHAAEEVWSQSQESLPVLHPRRLPATGVCRLQGHRSAQEALHQSKQDFLLQSRSGSGGVSASRQARPKCLASWRFYRTSASDRTADSRPRTRAGQATVAHVLVEQHLHSCAGPMSLSEAQWAAVCPGFKSWMSRSFGPHTREPQDRGEENLIIASDFFPGCGDKGHGWLPERPPPGCAHP